MPATGGKFRPTATGDADLDKVQRDIAAALDQLEDHRRGLLTAQVRMDTGALQLGEDLIVRSIATTAVTWVLPFANLRGPGVGQVLFVANAGGGTLTVTCAGLDTVNGVSSIALSTGAAALVFSDGQTKWFRVS